MTKLDVWALAVSGGLLVAALALLALAGWTLEQARRLTADANRLIEETNATCERAEYMLAQVREFV